LKVRILFMAPRRFFVDFLISKQVMSRYFKVYKKFSILKCL